jgi:hypothetical protein
MPSPTRNRPAALALAGLIAAFVAAACTPQPGASPGASGAGASGTSACAAAPAPPDDLAGWGPPAQAPAITPVLISGPGQVVCGRNRLLFTLLDASGRPVGAPDRTAKLAVYNLGRDPNAPIATVDGEFVWAIEDERGIYVANVSLPESGRYGAEVITGPAGETPQALRLTFDVQPSSDVVGVGDRAPASRTPTLADVGGDATKISTDTDPEPALYETSIDQAIAAGKPFVVIFATPKFCQTAQCGPTLDRIKPFLDRYPTVTFINVEPYKLKLVDGILQADVDANNQLQVAPTTEEWRLVNEPTVYVVDRSGIVTANFELIFSDRELTEALDAMK